MSADRIWLKPEYYDDFSCKCGFCRHTCCGGWKIAVGQKEYYNIIGLECSKELHEKIECSFSSPKEPSKERFRMLDPDWMGKCRLLDKDGLCSLQKECGPENIPLVCRVYPRSLRQENDVCIAVCSASCEAVAEKLICNKRLELSFGRLEEEPEIVRSWTEGYADLIRTYIDVIRLNTGSLEERLKGIFMSDMRFEPQPLSYKRMHELLNIFVEEAGSLREFIDGIYESHHMDSENIQEYEEEYLKKVHDADFLEFSQKYPEWSMYFENLIVNNILYSGFPFTDRRIGKEKSCYGLYLQYELLKMVCSGYTFGKMDKEALVDAVSAVYHLVEHTSFYYNAVCLLYRQS